jgi:PRTRC genetic system protein E
MFAALASILSPNQTLDLSITLAADGSMKVIVKPQLVKGTNVSLAIPLALSATPQELDADFVGSLMQYADQRTSLQQQVEVTATIMAEAKATEVTKASKAIKSNAKPAAKSASNAGDDHDDGDNDGDNGDDGNDTLGGDSILDSAPATSTSPSTTSAPAEQSAPAPAATNDDLLSALM